MDVTRAEIDWKADDLRCVLIDGENEAASCDGITISWDDHCVEAFVPYLQVGEHIAIPLVWIDGFTVGLITHPQG